MDKQKKQEMEISVKMFSYKKIILQVPTAQSAISANTGLNCNAMLWFIHFCSTVRFKTLKNKSSIDSAKQVV